MGTGSYANNRITLVGTILHPPQYSHTLYQENFYTLILCVPRLSGKEDILPITLPERFLSQYPLMGEDVICIRGQIRSYNRISDGKNHLVLRVFVRSISYTWEEDINTNELFLEGFICRKPTYRTTPFGREITDILLAVNRPYSKSDYIPIITWGVNARRAQEFVVGNKLSVEGRLQSREYQKKMDDEEVVTKTAYEVSVYSMNCSTETYESDQEK